MMDTVFLDGEDVTFSGDAPANIRTLVDLIQQHLAQDDKILSVCEVDGVDIMPLDPAEYPSHGTTIRMNSQPAAMALLNAIEDAVAATPDLVAQLIEFSGSILRRPWSKTIQDIDAFTAMLEPMYHLADTLHQHATARGLSWQNTVSDFLQARERVLSAFIDAAKRSDVAAASDIICHQIAPQIQKMRDAYEDTILPDLHAL